MRDCSNDMADIVWLANEYEESRRANGACQAPAKQTLGYQNPCSIDDRQYARAVQPVFSIVVALSVAPRDDPWA